MKKTYQLMLRLKSKELELLTNEDLAERFQQTKDERILATAYVKNINLIKKVCKKYSWVEDEDRVTATLMSLYKTMCKFSVNCKTKFGTYLYRALNRALMRATDTMLHKNRSDRLMNISLEDCCDTEKSYGIESNKPMSDILADKTFDWGSVDIGLDCEMSKALTFKEKQFCEICLIMTNPTSKVLREELKLTSMELFKLKKGLKQKIIKEMEI